MSSERELSALIGDISKSVAAQITTAILQNSSTSGDAASTAFQSARNALRSLQSDASLASDVSRSFHRSSPGTSNTSSTSRATLPSVARRQGSSHRWSGAPYNRNSRNRSSRLPRRYDMKLLVVDCLPELFSGPSKGSISTYRGEAIIETPLFLMEDQTADNVKTKIMDIIRGRFPDFEGQFFFASRRNRNILSIAAEQDLDARGVNTLKGSGCVYAVLDTSVAPDDEVSKVLLWNRQMFLLRNRILIYLLH